MKILVVAPSWIGDILMSQSLYKELKKRYKDSQIDVISVSWSCDILKRMPEIDNVLISPTEHKNFLL
ncbi:MAG: ADP-heptose--LPS heptosyltransferase, partial [Psittacicella sp.]